LNGLKRIRIKMKVLILTHCFPLNKDDPSGIFVYEIGKYLVGKGHDVSVVTLRFPGSLRYEEMDGISVYRFRFFGWKKGKILKQYGVFDVFSLISMVWNFRRCSEFVVRKFKPDVVHAYWVIPAGFVAACLKKRFKLVGSAPGSDINLMPNSLIMRLFVSWTLKRLDRLFCLGKCIVERSLKLGLRKGKEVLMYGDGGVDSSLFLYSNLVSGQAHELKRKYNLNREKVFIFVGRLDFPKRVDILLKALAVVKRDFMFIIVGDGVKRQYLENLVLKLGLKDKVIFAGSVKHDLIPGYLYLSDCMLFASTSEGMPSCILEAMVMGKLVITNPVGGVKDLIEDNKTGVFVRLESNDFAEKIVTFWDNKSDIGKNAAIFGKKNLLDTVMIEKIIKGYS